MAKYKLIKTYPGSPKLNSIVEWDLKQDSYRLQSATVNHFFGKDRIEDYPEYWEKVIEKDYEILSYQSKDRIIAPASNFAVEISKPGHWNVHSVKYNEKVFTIGDSVTVLIPQDYNKRYSCNSLHRATIIINEFIINTAEGGKVKALNNAPKGLYAYEKDHNFVIPIQYLEYKKKPLLITEEGIEIFDGDTFHRVSNLKDIYTHIASESKRSFYEAETTNPHYKIFHKKENAEEYNLMNIPRLSIKDVISMFHNSIETKNSITRKLKEIVKSKINGIS